MSKKRLGAAQGEDAESEEGNRPGLLNRLKALPGFRTAAVAFVLTVVLGAGSTIAYAFWSQSATVATISGTTRSEVPLNTTLVSSPAEADARPSTPALTSCIPALSHEQMKNNTFADINFAWTAAAPASKYVVTVRSASPGYTFADAVTKLDEKTVAAPQASFRFKRLQSKPNGDQKEGLTPFYARYTVRVMPMNGAVPGDPLYFTFEYLHRSNTCWAGATTTASPTGTAAPMTCTLPAFGGQQFSDATFSWASSSGADSYSVSLVSKNRLYGAKTSTPGTSWTFRVPWTAPVTDSSPYFGQYTVRVQPMKGAAAGDPVYVTYQLGMNDHVCWP